MLTETTVLQAHAHVVTPECDGFAEDQDEPDEGKNLRIADLLPEGAHGRRGTWRITVEFEEEPTH